MDKPANASERRRIAFIRAMLDRVLEGADATLVEDPSRYFDDGRSLPLSIRLCRAIMMDWRIEIRREDWRHVDGIRLRLGVEDFLNSCLIGAGKAALARMLSRDEAIAEGARTELAVRIAREFHRQGVVVRRRQAD